MFFLLLSFEVPVKVKWVHQLDYATSGVLSIALNRQALLLLSTYFSFLSYLDSVYVNLNIVSVKKMHTYVCMCMYVCMNIFL